MNTPDPRIEVQWTQTALDALLRIGGRAIQQKIVLKIESVLATATPERIGKPLQGELAGMYRITHGRFRIVYDVARERRNGMEATRVVVRIIYVGIRRGVEKGDVYVELARVLRRLGR
ncbi:MAG: type II toxin-antitoxin system RelE/ParE family toxin [Phycisphaerae bacterium]